MKEWLWRVLISIDRSLNVIFLGKPDETISTRSALAAKDGKAWGCVLCKLLNAIDTGHCDKSIKTDSKDAENVEIKLK